ncbi:MAG: alpha/beta hydrolase [Proteobacteria bacterium]|nr:alpha/beta hydrolase [Pseudomonadota bacterium]
MLFDWLPASKPGRPTVFFIHGGYWQFNSKEEFAFVAEGLLQSEINVALLGYSLAPSKRLSEIVGEIAAACRSVSESLEPFGAGYDWVLAGWSAGAHLAATQLHHLSATQRHHPRLRGAVLISGIYDLAPVQRSYLNAALDLTDRDIEELSPIRLVPNGTWPLVLSYGDRELPELQRQSEDCAAVWSRSVPNIEVGIVPGAHHYSVLEALAQPGGFLFTKVLEMLAAQRPL